MSARGGRAAPPLALLSALVVTGAGASRWTVVRLVRDVGGVPVESFESVSGTAFAPLLVPLGLAALLLALLLWPARGAPRRVAGVFADVLGSAAAVVVLLGLSDARAQAPGAALTAAPWLALAGAGGLMAAGMLAFLGAAAAPVLDRRFTVEGVQAAGDDEWTLASDDPPEDGRR